MMFDRAYFRRRCGAMEERQTTSAVNGRLWGSAAADWAAIQEGTCRPVYEAVFERVGLKAGARYLDVGCGTGCSTSCGERGAGLGAGRERQHAGDCARTSAGWGFSCGGAGEFAVC